MEMLHFKKTTGSICCNTDADK